MLSGIFHFERVATPSPGAMKRGNILCPIKEKNVRFPPKILEGGLTLIAAKMCESFIRYTTVTKNVKLFSPRFPELTSLEISIFSINVGHERNDTESNTN